MILSKIAFLIVQEFKRLKKKKTLPRFHLEISDLHSPYIRLENVFTRNFLDDAAYPVGRESNKVKK